MIDDWLIFNHRNKLSQLQIRKVGGGEAGVCVTQFSTGWSSSSNTETFINKAVAIKLIKALMRYFKISRSEISKSYNKEISK